MQKFTLQICQKKFLFDKLYDKLVAGINGNSLKINTIDTKAASTSELVSNYFLLDEYLTLLV